MVTDVNSDDDTGGLSPCVHDLGYQYTMRSGNFYPYMNGVSATYVSNETGRVMELRNDCHAVSVKDNRHQLLCSLTYSF